MPEPVVYLLFALGAVLVIGGFAKPRRSDSAVKKIDLRVETDFVLVSTNTAEPASFLAR